MLKIFFGDNPGDNYIFNPDVFFNNTYEDEWITSETSRKMIKDIDGSEVKGPCMIDSPFLGPIPPERLSGGVKTLILMQNDPDHIFNASACGNNCAQWILKLAEQKDITILTQKSLDELISKVKSKNEINNKKDTFQPGLFG